jgi:hypothetical protein
VPLFDPCVSVSASVSAGVSARGGPGGGVSLPLLDAPSSIRQDRVAPSVSYPCRYDLSWHAAFSHSHHMSKPRQLFRARTVCSDSIPARCSSSAFVIRWCCTCHIFTLEPLRFATDPHPLELRCLISGLPRPPPPPSGQEPPCSLRHTARTPLVDFPPTAGGEIMSLS